MILGLLLVLFASTSKCKLTHSQHMRGPAEKTRPAETQPAETQPALVPRNSSSGSMMGIAQKAKQAVLRGGSAGAIAGLVQVLAGH